mmetsp:Transcript_23450/g.65045  ORF Transcript_23450/g.65045 Transcript_23450/m.65045 type:complete len:256 (+) Transcript_23450:332-1099(+)
MFPNNNDGNKEKEPPTLSSGGAPNAHAERPQAPASAPLAPIGSSRPRVLPNSAAAIRLRSLDYAGRVSSLAPPMPLNPIVSTPTITTPVGSTTLHTASSTPSRGFTAPTPRSNSPLRRLEPYMSGIVYAQLGRTEAQQETERAFNANRSVDIERRKRKTSELEEVAEAEREEKRHAVQQQAHLMELLQQAREETAAVQQRLHALQHQTTIKLEILGYSAPKRQCMEWSGARADRDAQCTGAALPLQLAELERAGN